MDGMSNATLFCLIASNLGDVSVSRSEETSGDQKYTKMSGCAWVSAVPE
jgi:hypothetical protein